MKRGFALVLTLLLLNAYGAWGADAGHTPNVPTTELQDLNPLSGDVYSQLDTHVYRNQSVTPEQLSTHIANESEQLGLNAGNQTVISVIGPITVEVEGEYTVTQRLDDTLNVGRPIFSYVTSINLSAASQQNASLTAHNESLIFDDNWQATTVIPSNRNVHVVASLNPGTYIIMLATVGQVAQLPVTIIEPVRSEDVRGSVLDNIVETVSADIPGLTSQDIKFLTYENLSAPQEPTSAMTEEMRNDGYTAAYKLDTVSVDQSGQYLAKIIIPDEFVGKDVDSLNMYVLRRVNAASGSVRATAIIGAIGAWVDAEGLGLNMFGKEALALLTLQAGEPFSVYLAKILLMLLGGCDTGLGLGAVGLAVVIGGAVAFRLFRRR